MNSYLKNSGRFVGALLFAVGVVAMAAGVYSLIDSVPHWMVQDARVDGWRHVLNGAGGTVGWFALSLVSFRHWSKLRKEGRKGSPT